jgi:molecular chaperone IbpA
LTSTASTFPPVNIIKTGDYTYNVELAVAGYKRDEIEITAEKNSLRVSGKKTEKDEKEYLAKGIAGRSFSRQFVLSDTVVVQGAELADGILSISLENVIPESQKPRKVEIK